MDRRDFLTVTSVAGLGLCVVGPGLAAARVGSLRASQSKPMPGLTLHGSARHGCTGTMYSQDFPPLADFSTRL